MRSLLSRLVRGGVLLAVSIASSAASAGCFFSLDDVVSNRDGGSGDTGAQPFDGGGDDGGGSTDGSVEQDAAPRLTSLGRVCSKGRVTSMAVTNGTLLAVCSDTGWSIDGAPTGAIVTASARDPFTASTPLGIDGNVLGASTTDAYAAGPCGLTRITAQGTTTALTPVLPTTITAIRVGGGVVQFAGLGDDGVSSYDIADGTCADASACTPDPGCTRAVGPTGGTSMGLAAIGNAHVDYVCPHATRHAALVPYTNTVVQSPIFTDGDNTCDGDVPFGVAATGSNANNSKVYFGVGSTLYQCKVGNGSNCTPSSTEAGPVTLVTGSVSPGSVAWVAGSRLRLMINGEITTVGELDDRATALAFDGDNVLVGTLGGAVYRTNR